MSAVSGGGRGMGGTDDPLARLAAMGLLPAPSPRDARELGLVADGPVDDATRARGALVGGAIGDALGRPGEARPRAVVRERYGELRDFVPWRGYVSGPVGTVTDDTQLTMVVARCLVDHDGRLDVDDLTRALLEWYPQGRGMGRATRQACGRLASGVPWWQSGTPSGGNGAAMRVAPIGVVRRNDVDALRRDVALSAVPTHRDPIAIAGAVVHAFTVAWLSHRVGPIDAEAVVGAVLLGLDGVRDPGAVPRSPGAQDPERLADRIARIPDLLARDADEVFDHFYNGAFVLESVPCALWCFLRFCDDPETALVTAASGGHDSDTIAAMAGAYAGALLGVDAFPDRWRNDLEHAAELATLGDRLAALASRTAPDGARTRPGV